MGNILKPLLAETIEDISTLKYPVIVSPKLDGYRCLIVGGKALSRSFKPIRNTYIRNYLESLNLPDGLDGELLSGNTFQDCSSAISSEDGEPDFVFNIFDYVKDDPNKPYIDRIKDLDNLCLNELYENKIKVIKSCLILNEKQLLEVSNKYLQEGHEGTMIRSLFGKYKFGRSSLKEGILLKLKPFKDAEAKIVGFTEQMHNTNEAKKDAFGKTKRSHHKAGKIPAGTLGVFRVVGVGDFDGIDFDIGTGEGLTKELRQKIWNNQNNYIGKLIKYKYQLKGTKDKPREPIFLGFRDEDDL